MYTAVVEASSQMTRSLPVLELSMRHASFNRSVVKCAGPVTTLL